MADRVETLGSALSDADLCRANGWGAGTRLDGVESGEGWSHTDTIVITAVGEQAILARCKHNDREAVWTLRHRSWVRVEEEADRG